LPRIGRIKADRIVAEVNNGGDMVEATLRMVDPNIPFHGGARVARQGRARRAGCCAL
jgi:phage terminase large subunit-like protein